MEKIFHQLEFLVYYVRQVNQSLKIASLKFRHLKNKTLTSFSGWEFRSKEAVLCALIQKLRLLAALTSLMCIILSIAQMEEEHRGAHLDIIYGPDLGAAHIIPVICPGRAQSHATANCKGGWEM